MPDTVAARPSDRGFVLRLLLSALVLAAVVAGTGFWAVQRSKETPGPTAVLRDPAGENPVAPPVGGAKPGPASTARPLFADWPKDAPDLVLVVSGQTFGYLQPCGCSRPQFGGLERRYNLIRSLTDKGWEVAAVDVGDVGVPPGGPGLRAQQDKKYEFALKAMQAMGYVAAAVGKTEFAGPIDRTLGFAVNNPRPAFLAANLTAVKDAKATPRAEYFKGTDRPAIGDLEVYQGKKVSAAVVGAVAKSVGDQVAAADKSFAFPDPQADIAAAFKAAGEHPAKPELNVLLLQGSETEAQAVAAANPNLHLVVCLSEMPDPPSLPVAPPKANPGVKIVTVGHKGMFVGVVGVFKTPAGFDLRYQLVKLGEEYLTSPDAVAKGQPVLQLFERYAKEVKDDEFLAKFTKDRKEHNTAILNPKAGVKFVGAEACKKCHAAEFAKWSTTKHAGAYAALEKATRPSLQQYNPECVQCHTTGFEFAGGFADAKATPALLNNGCENCHGPGGGHADNPKDAKLLAALAPWKMGNRENRLPDLKFIEKMAKMTEDERGKVEWKTPAQVAAVNNLRMMCMRCHDLENDPHFELWTYLPKIHHSGLKAEGLPEGAK